MFAIVLFWAVLFWLLALGALALCNLILVRVVEALIPPMGRFIEIEGLLLHVVDSGDPSSGPSGHSRVEARGQAVLPHGEKENTPIVFIHGLLGQLNHFTFALAARFPERRVVLIDRPGSGYSEPARPQTIKVQADIIARAIERLGLKCPLVVGHSFGGTVALAVALGHSDKIGGLALIAPLTQLDKAPPKSFGALHGRGRLSLWLGAWTLGPLITLARTKVTRDVVFAPDSMPMSYWTKAGGLLGARPSALMSAASDIVTQPRELPDMLKRYGSLDLPIGVLFGPKDGVLDAKSQGADFCLMAPAAILTPSSGGHMLPVAAPDETEAFIRKTLERLDGRMR
jgi:pimeloyl-ACP methyl ester carboxylesterase